MSLSSDLSFLAEGTKMTAELADFLKAAHWDRARCPSHHCQVSQGRLPADASPIQAL
jgi:hypothetical protein